MIGGCGAIPEKTMALSVLISLRDVELIFLVEEFSS
jgi:hypothetical protein